MTCYTTLKKRAAEVKNFAVRFDADLVTDEDLTGTPTVTELYTSALTISNVGLNLAERPVSGVNVAANRAVEFTVAGGTRGQVYTLQVAAGSSHATSPQSLTRLVRLMVI